MVHRVTDGRSIQRGLVNGVRRVAACERPSGPSRTAGGAWALGQLPTDDPRRAAFLRLRAERAHGLAEHHFPKIDATGERLLIRDDHPLVYHPRGESEAQLLARVPSPGSRFMSSQ